MKKTSSVLFALLFGFSSAKADLLQELHDYCAPLMTESDLSTVIGHQWRITAPPVVMKKGEATQKTNQIIRRLKEQAKDLRERYPNIFLHETVPTPVDTPVCRQFGRDGVSFKTNNENSDRGRMSHVFVSDSHTTVMDQIIQTVKGVGSPHQTGREIDYQKTLQKDLSGDLMQIFVDKSDYSYYAEEIVCLDNSSQFLRQVELHLTIDLREVSPAYMCMVLDEAREHFEKELFSHMQKISEAVRALNENPLLGDEAQGEQGLVPVYSAEDLARIVAVIGMDLKGRRRISETEAMPKIKAAARKISDYIGKLPEWINEYARRFPGDYDVARLSSGVSICQQTGLPSHLKLVCETASEIASALAPLRFQQSALKLKYGEEEVLILSPKDIGDFLAAIPQSTQFQVSNDQFRMVKKSDLQTTEMVLVDLRDQIESELGRRLHGEAPSSDVDETLIEAIGHSDSIAFLKNRNKALDLWRWGKNDRVIYKVGEIDIDKHQFDTEGTFQEDVWTWISTRFREKLETSLREELNKNDKNYLPLFVMIDATLSKIEWRIFFIHLDEGGTTLAPEMFYR